MGPRRRLKRVDEAVHLLAGIAVLELHERRENPGSEIPLEPVEMDEDQVVILLRPLRHAAIADNRFDSGVVWHGSAPLGDPDGEWWIGCRRTACVCSLNSNLTGRPVFRRTIA